MGRCLFYIDLNMVRAGAVTHPLEWKHAGIHELIGNKKRYRIINRNKLLNALDFNQNAFAPQNAATLIKKVIPRD